MAVPHPSSQSVHLDPPVSGSWPGPGQRVLVPAVARSARRNIALSVLKGGDNGRTFTLTIEVLHLPIGLTIARVRRGRVIGRILRIIHQHGAGRKKQVGQSSQDCPGEVPRGHRELPCKTGIERAATRRDLYGSDVTPPLQRTVKIPVPRIRRARCTPPPRRCSRALRRRGDRPGARSRPSKGAQRSLQRAAPQAAAQAASRECARRALCRERTARS